MHMECRAQNLPAGGTLQIPFPNLPLQGLCPILSGCKLPMHQLTAQVPSPSHFCSLLSVVPLVFPTSSLPSTPVFLVGLKQLPSPSASTPLQISSEPQHSRSSESLPHQGLKRCEPSIPSRLSQSFPGRSLASEARAGLPAVEEPASKLQWPGE